MPKKKCPCCKRNVPERMFDVLMGTEVARVLNLCIMCVLKETRKIVGSAFVFTDKKAKLKLCKYCAYFKVKA